MTNYSWTGVSGDWTTAADWSPAGVPGASDAATISAAGAYTVAVAAGESVAASTVSLNDASATLSINGTLSLGGVLTLTNGTLALTGTLAGGTLAEAGGSTVFLGGTLAAVTVRGPLTVNDNGSLNVTGGLRVTGANGTGPGVVNVTGPTSSVLNIADSETLNALTINVGSNGGADELAANGASLTIGSSVTINSVGTSGLLLDGAASVSNLGTIVAGVAGGTGSISSGTFSNAGVIKISNGQIFSISPQDGNFANTGRVGVSSGASLDVAAAVSGTGTLALDGNGTLELNGNVAASQSILFNGTGGELVLDNSTQVQGTIKGFASGDRIDILGASVDGSGVTFANGKATLTGNVPASLTFAGNYAGRGFGLVSDGNGSSFLITGTQYNVGSNATISTTGNAIVNATGTNDVIKVGGDAVIQSSGGRDIISAGNGNVVLTVSGNYNVAVVGNGTDVLQANANVSAFVFGNGNDEINVTGTNDVIYTGNGGSTVNVTGNYDAISVGSGSNQVATSGTGDIVSIRAGGSSVSVSGTSDKVFVGSSSSAITDNASGLNVYVGSGAGNSTIANVAADPSFVLDLTGGAGGYTTAAQAYAALTSDGNGGSLLTLSTGGSIDFLGVASTQLSANNFHVVTQTSSHTA